MKENMVNMKLNEALLFMTGVDGSDVDEKGVKPLSVVVLRVSGGWIYHFLQSSVFVPERVK